MRLLLILTLTYYSYSVFGQINLRLTEFGNYLFRMPNDSTIETGSCPSIGRIGIELKKNSYNSITKTLHINGRFFDVETREPLPYVSVVHCDFDLETLKIRPIKIYSSGSSNNFDLKIKMKKGQFVIFREISYLPAIFKLDDLKEMKSSKSNFR